MLEKYTYEELWEEYFAWRFIEDPDFEAESTSNEDGDVIIKTGDAKFDELQKRMAEGEDVDIVEALMNPEEAKALKAKLKAKYQPVEVPEELKEGFADDYEQE